MNILVHVPCAGVQGSSLVAVVTKLQLLGHGGAARCSLTLLHIATLFPKVVKEDLLSPEEYKLPLFHILQQNLEFLNLLTFDNLMGIKGHLTVSLPLPCLPSSLDFFPSYFIGPLDISFMVNFFHLFFLLDLFLINSEFFTV
jgi:hypothetical protein